MRTRKLEWRSALQAWALNQVGSPYVWGATDCATLAREALKLMFGADLINMPKWTSAREAVLALQSVGSISSVLEKLGAEETTLAFLRAGDIVIWDEPVEPVGGKAVMIAIDGRKGLMTGVEEGVQITDLPMSGHAKVYSLWEIADG